MLQLKGLYTPTEKILHAATKARHSQINTLNKYFFFKCRNKGSLTQEKSNQLVLQRAGMGEPRAIGMMQAATALKWQGNPQLLLGGTKPQTSLKEPKE